MRAEVVIDSFLDHRNYTSQYVVISLCFLSMFQKKNLTSVTLIEIGSVTQSNKHLFSFNLITVLRNNNISPQDAKVKTGSCFLGPLVFCVFGRWFCRLLGVNLLW